MHVVVSGRVLLDGYMSHTHTHTHTVQAKVAFHEYYQHSGSCVIVVRIPVFKTFRMLICLHIMIFFMNTVVQSSG